MKQPITDFYQDELGTGSQILPEDTFSMSDMFSPGRFVPGLSLAGAAGKNWY